MKQRAKATVNQTSNSTTGRFSVWQQNTPTGSVGLDVWTPAKTNLGSKSQAGFFYPDSYSTEPRVALNTGCYPEMQTFARIGVPNFLPLQFQLHINGENGCGMSLMRNVRLVQSEPSLREICLRPKLRNLVYIN